MSEREQNGWQPANVGCHWTRGEFTASTIVCGRESGYVLTRNHQETIETIAEFISWQEVEQLADRRNQEDR